MKYIQILDSVVCSSDIDSCCSDYGIAQYIYALKQVMEIIHFVVPIILIIMIAVQLIKMLSSPDDPQGKKMKSLINKIIATVLIFFIPYIVDLFVSLIPNSFSVASCWQSADDIVTVMNEYEFEELENEDPYEDSRKKVNDEYETFGVSEQNQDSTTNNNSNKNNKKDNDNNNADIGNPEGTDNASKNVKKMRKKVVNYALKFKGNPYVWGGNSLTNGVDCSGFVQQVYAKFGYSLERKSTIQAEKNGKKVSTKNLQPADLIFYAGSNGVVNHVALYIGNNQIIHASNPKEGIKISTYNYRTPVVVRRIITK